MPGRSSTIHTRCTSVCTNYIAAARITFRLPTVQSIDLTVISSFHIINVTTEYIGNLIPLYTLQGNREIKPLIFQLCRETIRKLRHVISCNSTVVLVNLHITVHIFETEISRFRTTDIGIFTLALIRILRVINLCLISEYTIRYQSIIVTDRLSDFSNESHTLGSSYHFINTTEVFYFIPVGRDIKTIIPRKVSPSISSRNSEFDALIIYFSNIHRHCTETGKLGNRYIQ